MLCHAGCGLGAMLKHEAKLMNYRFLFFFFFSPGLCIISIQTKQEMPEGVLEQIYWDPAHAPSPPPSTIPIFKAAPSLKLEKGERTS